ncbi:hypothetical protein BGZ74_009782 [Mortierella antarctica]|nr:hypothetical protein BGZ74_009782 [Mortierella antarctica]
MRFISVALLALFCSVVLAREDTAEVCSGAVACDAGYCCSSHVLDKQDTPRVISYDELGQSTVKDLAKRLAEEGSHVSPDDLKKEVTLETMLEKGVAEREKMLASMPKPAPPPSVQPVGSPDSASKTTDSTTDTNPKDKKSASSRNTGTTVLAVAIAMGALALNI